MSKQVRRAVRQVLSVGIDEVVMQFGSVAEYAERVLLLPPGLAQQVEDHADDATL